MKDLKATTRRNFLKTTAGAALAVAAPTIIPASALGRGGRPAPSNRITIGSIGVGGLHPMNNEGIIGECQGSVNMRAFMNHDVAQVVAVCDVDTTRRENAQRIVEQHYSAEKAGGTFKGCAAYNDFRELIARPDIDAISVAVPDQWHALMTIMAANAGKDIYSEKPLSLTIAEGRAMIEAVRRNGRVFQTGSQLRSMAHFRNACELVRNGRLGKLHTIRASFHNSPSIAPQPEMPIPAGFDYDMWLGPAPWARYTKRRCHYDFRWISDYSGGQVTDHGAHYTDLGQWGHGTTLTGPVEVVGKGDFPREGLWDVASNYNIEWTFADGVKFIATEKPERNNPVYVSFHGSEGSLFLGGQIVAEPKSILTSVVGPDEIHLYKSDDHHGNFLDCIKTRGETVAPIEQAHRSASICHLGIIAMQLGRKLRWDPDKERFVNDPEADRMLSRAMRAPWRLE